MIRIEEIKAQLEDIKIIPNNWNKLSDKELYKVVLDKIDIGKNFEIAYNINNFKLLNISLELLGYRDDNNLEKAKELGLYVCEGEFTKDEFLKSIYSLLRAKTKDNKEFFDLLCLNGVFADYNKDRQVPRVLYFNGKTRPIFDFEKAIFEEVFVETPLDTDQDGKRDLIKVYVRRPYETEIGMEVPSIYIASPYMMGGDDDGYILHNVEREIPYYEETNISYEYVKFKGKEFNLPNPREIMGQGKANILKEEVNFDSITLWYNYFLCRGYALVLAGGIGTRGSEGVRTCGSVEETISTISVIDWLNKRLPGFTDKTNNISTSAFWSTGNIGMTGKSYLGTLANGAATTGVDGLKTIVPEAAISNWYDYYRSNGLLSSAYEWQGDDADLLAKYCFSRAFDKDDENDAVEFFKEFHKKLIEEEDRVSGNYNEFWDERNYLNNVKNIKASIFIVHGLNDFNVKPKQFQGLWKAMENHSIEKRMLLHQGDHIYLNDHLNFDYTHIMNKWFDHYLYEYDNNILEEVPDVIIQNNTNTDLFDYSTTWPFNGVKQVSYYIDGSSISLNKGKNTVRGFNNDLSLIDLEENNRNIWADNLIQGNEVEETYRLKYSSEELTEDTRISGLARLKLKEKLDNNVGILSGMLVDFGRCKRPTLELEDIDGEFLNLGLNGGNMPYKKFKLGDETDYRVITRESINVQNRRNTYNKDEVLIGGQYDFEIDLEPMDYTLLKGHRLGLIIYSTDIEMTEKPIQLTNFQVDESSIELVLPIK